VPDVARTWVLDAHGGPDVLRLAEGPIPVPGDGQLLVEVEVAGVNFGDTMIRRGQYLRDQPLGFAPGLEAVGRVSEVGVGVEPSRAGTRVACFVEAGGAYATHVVAPAHRAYPVPDDLDAGAICTVFFQGTTAHYALHRYGRLAAGETVLVHGAAGGVGGLAVKLAKLGGAAVVVATASTTAKRERALADGADVALDSGAPDALTAAIRAATGGHGADVVVDGVGGRLFAPSLRALARRGRYVVVGSSSQEPAMLDVRRLLPRTQTVCGFILADVAAEDPAEPLRTLTHLCDLVRAGRLQPRYETAPLDQAAEVHRRMDARLVTGKVVLRP